MRNPSFVLRQIQLASKQIEIMSSNKKPAYYTEMISFYIAPSQKKSLTALLFDGQRLSAYARSTIDPDRIIEPYNDAKERETAIVLAALSGEFDEAIFAIRGALKKDYLANFNESSALKKIMFSILKISHNLVDVCEKYHDEKSLNKRHVLAKIIKEKDECLTEKLSFKIPKDLMSVLRKKCVGDESISQVCRLMLCPYGVIIPSNTNTLKIITKWSAFYSSRILSLTQQIEGRMDDLNLGFNEAARVAVINLLETLTDLQRLIEKGLNAEPVNCNNKN
ncbi:hypothetical protein [Salinivibrio sp. SS2]|uniref:hypothetical protein n=1 Tax=Salinivibrio sp. SS2 TaxID=1892894 RepID=UPI00084CE289|nr:hypothetical protein [Salinivibrio sp. DV]ODQ00614.1 hypothetical protein BGK46_06075 [Salinivibrio sp. DV]